MSDIVPAGWGVSTILELGSNHKDCVQTGPFGAQLHAEDYVGEGIPLILIRNIKESGLDTRGMPKITEEDAERLSRYRLKIGDIVFSRVGRVGSCFLTTSNEEGWVISGQTLRMRTSNALIEPEYLLHALRAEKVQKDIVGESVGSTRTSINTNILENLEVNVPPLPEQKKIAAILTSVDDVVEKTQAQIEKLKDLKTGMMQELLTRGVGVDGKPYTEFKDSPVGRIPKGWEVRRLDSLATVVDSMHKTPRFTESGKPMVRVTEIRQSEVLNISGAMNVDKDTFDTFSKNYRPRFGDTLIARVGAYFGATSYIGDTKEFCLGQNTASIRPVHIDSNYLFIYLNSQIIRQQMDDAVAVGAQPSLSLKAIKELSIALPSTDEQELIAKSICSVRNKVDALVNKLNQQKLLKKALMQDLLTGKVRVKVES
ncbi:restriction endonuclease subunit S [Vibrio campbellii]|uniref:restriction endonuclease subunit S n=1 Tax=Vibrio campbellii TaxID=680 RepID=UPI0006814A81|nr:restriction endonuclease subunit S [Vibrio campbellii]